MLKIGNPAKFAVAPEFEEARASCCGVAVFIATFVVLGIIASLTSSLDIRSVMPQDETIPVYAQLQTR